jgi:hypothetical protein
VFVMFRQGSLRCRMARFNHSLGQRACDCERRGVEWIMVSSGAVMFGLSGCVVLRHRMNTTIVLARRPINAAVVASSQARWCTVSRCAERRVVFWQNHTRAGTVPDQRGRCGLNYGMFSQVAACFVPLRPGGSRLLTKLVQARCRINAGGLGCTMEWCGGLMLVLASHCRAR